MISRVTDNLCVDLHEPTTLSINQPSTEDMIQRLCQYFADRYLFHGSVISQIIWNTTDGQWYSETLKGSSSATQCNVVFDLPNIRVSITKSSFKLGEHRLVRYSFAILIFIHDLRLLTDPLHRTASHVVFTAHIYKCIISSRISSTDLFRADTDTQQQ